MTGSLIGLIPLMVGAAVVPVWGVIILLIIGSENGRIKAAAFTAGAILVRLAQGVLFGFMLNRVSDEAGGETNLVVSTLLLVVGIVLFVTGIKTWLREDDPDAPPPGWKDRLNQLSTGSAFKLGALLTVVAIKQWVFTLSAIGVIEAASPATAESVILYLMFTAGATLIMSVPVVISYAVPRQSARAIAAARDWLDRNSRAITIVVSFAFGAFFLWRGITGLLSG